MRIGTWNLERHGAADRICRQRDLIKGARADVFVLTEVHCSFDFSDWTVVRSIESNQDKQSDDSWVAIIGNGLDRPIPPLPRRKSSVAARVEIGGELLILYGTVLPWLRAPDQAPDLALPNETYNDMFGRVLRKQVEDLKALQLAHSEAIIVWAGDFNQSLSGSNRGGSNDSRALLKKTLCDLDLIAWNEHMAHAIPGMKAIDLICGPAKRPVKAIDRLDPVADGHKLSDHAGYVVEI